MPLIAKTPQYISQRKVPGTIGVPYADLRPSAAENRAIGRIGELIGIRAQEMKQERDAAVVGDIYNQWRDEDRKILSDLFNRKGKDAAGLEQEYDKFFVKSAGGTDQAAENGAQQAELKNMLARRREQNLDNLARYQAAEGQRYLKEQQAGIFANAVEDGRQAGKDDKALANAIYGAANWIGKAYPSMAPEAKEALGNEVKSKILIANIEGKIEDDPDRAIEDIEKWREGLGGAYGDLKQVAKAKQKSKLIDNLQAELQLKYEENGVPNFAKMRKDLTHQKGVPGDVKFEVRQWVDAYQNQYESTVVSNEIEAHDNAEREIGMLFLDGDYVGVRQKLREYKNFLSGDEIKSWATAIKNAPNAEKKIDPVKNAAEHVNVMQMITQSWPEQELKKYIVASPFLGTGEKKQYLGQIEKKLSSSIEAGRKEGYQVITSVIFPKVRGLAGKMQNMMQTETMSHQQLKAIMDSKSDLDDWINFQVQNKKYPSRREIRDMAYKFGLENQTKMADRMEILNKQ